MPLYYSDESREPRDCPCECHRSEGPCDWCEPLCRGTDRLGEEAALPDLQIIYHAGDDHWSEGYYWRCRTRSGPGYTGWHGMDRTPYPSEAAALAAAREAAKR